MWRSLQGLMRDLRMSKKERHLGALLNPMPFFFAHRFASH